MRMVGFPQDVLCIDGMVAVVFLCDIRVLFKHCEEQTFCLSYVILNAFLAIWFMRYV